jgi:hypothetical protein
VQRRALDEYVTASNSFLTLSAAEAWANRVKCHLDGPGIDAMKRYELISNLSRLVLQQFDVPRANLAIQSQLN